MEKFDEDYYDPQVENEEMYKIFNSQSYPFHSICLFGDCCLELAKRFLEENEVDIHAQNNEGNTAIITACENKAVGVINFLLENGANFNDRNSVNDSVLHLLCTNLTSVSDIQDCIELVTKFSKKIADFNSLNDNDASALHRLCRNESKNGAVKIELANFAERLIELGADVNIEDALGNTALHIACATGSEIARILIPLVADIDARDHQGNSALHLACQSGHTEIAQMLLERYSDISEDFAEFAEYPPFRNALGKTPLDLANICGHQDTLEMLVENNFSEASENFAEEDRDGLIFEKTSAQFSQDEFSAHVMDSIKIISREDLELDIKSCATIENEGERNNALIASFKKMCLNLEKDLDSFGNDFDIANPRLYSMWTQQRDNFVQKILTTLEPNIADDSNTTALHLLCQYGFIAATKFVIESGENLEPRNNQGQTALHLACEYGHGEIASLLIESGCDRNAINPINQETPFDTALHNMHYDVATMLSEKFNVNISDSTAQLLSNQTMSQLEEGRKTELTYLANTIIKKNPSPYPQPNDGSKKFTATAPHSERKPNF